MTNNFTTLVGVKWNHESMLQVHEIMWTCYVKKLVNSKRLTIPQKHQRITDMSEWFNLIHNLCINKELTIKKE